MIGGMYVVREGRDGEGMWKKIHKRLKARGKDVRRERREGGG